MRPINADVLLKNAVDAGTLHPGVSVVTVGSINIAPTINAMPVVECRHCCKWEPRYDMATGNALKEGHCSYWHGRRDPDDFCRYSEKRNLWTSDTLRK